jgi:hypothetical protein
MVKNKKDTFDYYLCLLKMPYFLEKWINICKQMIRKLDIMAEY